MVTRVTVTILARQAHTIDTKKVALVTITLKVGKWDNGIRVGISEKMKVGVAQTAYGLYY